MKTPSRHVSMKKKFVRANEVTYITKALQKAIMKRFEVESKYLKNKNYQNMKFIKSKKTFAANYIREEKKLF